MAQPTSSGSEGRDLAAVGAPTMDIDLFDGGSHRPVPVPSRTARGRGRSLVRVLRRVGNGALRTGPCGAARLQTFMSGAGVGIHDLRVEGSWRPPSLLLEADPPDHTVVRQIIEDVLSPRAVKILREILQARADGLVDQLASIGRFDAATELAQVFPVQAFSDEVGVPKEGRENLLPYGDRPSMGSDRTTNSSRRRWRTEPRLRHGS